MGLIDLHCHILPGLDDGPPDLAGAIAMAEAQVAAGIDRVAATPHVNHRFPNHSGAIAERHAELVAALAERDIPLTVELGAEVAATAAMQLGDEELRSLRLGGGRWLLLEPPSTVDAIGIVSLVGEVQARGHRILLAHPERITALRESPGVLESLVRGGAKTQITASALTGRYGSSVERYTRDLFEAGLVGVVSSDAHHAETRPPGLAEDLRRGGYGHLTGGLCEENPRAILDD